MSNFDYLSIHFSVISVSMKWLKNTTLYHKLLFFFLALGILPALLVGVYVFYKSKHAIIDRTFDQLTSVRKVKTRQIEGFIYDRSRELDLISQLNDVQEMFYNFSQREPSVHLIENTNIYNRFLKDYLSRHKYFEKIYFSMETPAESYSFEISKDTNRNICNSDSLEFFTEALKHLHSKSSKHISDYVITQQKKAPSIFISKLIEFPFNKQSGVLTLQLSSEAVNEIMLEKTPADGLGNSGESYLVGKDFMLRSSSRFSTHSMLKTQVKTDGSIQAFNGEEGTSIIKDYRGILVLSSFGSLSIPGLDWIIMVEMDEKEALGSIRSIENDLIFIYLLVGILVVGLSLALSKGVVSPLNKLKDAALKVGEGDYDITLSESENDEIGALILTFNKMTARIKSQTSQLKEREERLGHFYDATVDGIFLHENNHPLLVNKALIVFSGYSEDEIMQLRLDQLIKLKDSDPAKISEPYETVAICKNGSEFPVEVQENHVDYKGRKIKACVIRNIAKRKEIETALQIERRKSMSSLFDGQEIERQRLSRDLHDGLGQTLIALKLQLESKENKRLAGEDRNLIEEINEINKTIDEVRQICNNLRPPVLSEFGLDNAVRQLCELFEKRTSIKIEYNSSGDLTILNDKIVSYLYRIIQEGLNNSLKHSKCSVINIYIHKENTFVMLIIEDDGIGFEQAKIQKGNGIYNMKERAALLNGTCKISTSPGSGTIVTIKIPITHE